MNHQHQGAAKYVATRFYSGHKQQPQKKHANNWLTSFVPMMRAMPRLLALPLLLCGLHASPAAAQDISLLPKYGSAVKNEAQRLADKRFLAGMDEQFQGDRIKAGQEARKRGWQSLHQGNLDEAMRRFNQAWLIDEGNADALWGMAAVLGSKGKSAESLKLFKEAEPALRDDIDFEVDYALALSGVAVDTKNEAALQQVYEKFASIHKKAPQNTLNLQNWAITLAATGNYAEAWKKIILAEATPNPAAISPGFVAALQKQMPRP